MTVPPPVSSGSSSNHRTLRRMAFQALFQFDAQDGRDPHMVKSALTADLDAGSTAPVEEAFKLALAAWSTRAAADEAMRKLAPTWPAHRQAAVDRAILRLAFHEIVQSDKEQGKHAINDAVALAKEFSTDKSPAFINALLDKIYKGEV